MISKNDKDKKIKSKAFGDLRFDFLKACKHDFRSNANCPLCKLVTQSTRKFFDEEAESNRLARLKSLLNRAQMRINLLQNWSRCQNSFFGDFDSTHKLEIVVSKSLADMIVLMHHEKSTEIDFSEIMKILNRKNRMKEVGYFAAIYLQCRIRKYLAKQRLRHILLRRFELVPATRRKAEFFVDNLRLHKWTRLPYLLQHENPGSPRTIERRINADTKKREARMQQFQIAWNRCDSDDLLNREHLMVRLQKQLVLFRDLVAVAMFRLSKHSPIHSQSFNNSYNSLVSSVANGSSYYLGSASGEDGFGTANKYCPVWLSLSAPAAPPRQLGLSLALAILPPVGSRPVQTQVSNGPVPETQGSSPGKAGPPNSPVRKSSVVGMNYNRALQQLESKAWECLRCATPEEVTAKLLSAELLPSVESVLNITQDEHGIWQGQLDFVKPNLNAIAGAPAVNSVSATKDSAAHSDGYLGPMSNLKPVAVSTKQEAVVEPLPLKYQAEVLPLSVQLRLYHTDRTANGFFRLFFYEEEFVAATQVSPWAFYPELLKSRDPVVAALKHYANSASTKALVRQYLQQVNAQYQQQMQKNETASGATSAASSNRRNSNASANSAGSSMTSKSAASAGGKKASTAGQLKGVMSMLSLQKSAAATVSHKESAVGIPPSSSLFVPPEDLIFEGRVVTAHDYSEHRPVDVAGLTDVTAIELNNKYKFISKLGIFSERLKRALNNTRNKKPNTTTAADARKHSNASASSAGIISLAKDYDSLHSDGSTAGQPSAALPYLPDSAQHPQNAQLSEEQIRDMYCVQQDLLGSDIFHLLLGDTPPEHSDLSQIDTHAHHINTIAENSAFNGKRGRGEGIAGGDSDEDTESVLSANDSLLQQPPIVLGRYASKLNAYCSAVQPDIASRIVTPKDVQLKPYTYQLMVIDVYVSLPKPTATKTGPNTKSNTPLSSVTGRPQTGFASPGTSVPNTARSENGPVNTAINTARSGNTNVSEAGGLGGTGGTTSRRGTQQPNINISASALTSDFTVDTHHIVGMFACNNERSPPNLECGLLSWSYFHSIYLERSMATVPHKLGLFAHGPGNPTPSINSSSTSIPTTVGGGGNTRDRSWSVPHPSSGLSIHKMLLPTGREFQFHMLAAAPSREHLDKELPNKVKTWLGMPILK